MHGESVGAEAPVSISVYLDDATEPLCTYKPPAHVEIDTAAMRDGDHVLRISAIDSIGNVGVRTIPFTVANGPGITVTGLRAGARVRGSLALDINAFGSNEPFDVVRAESSGPVPVWTWVFFAIVVAWAGWYGIEYLSTPAAFLQTPTYATDPALVRAGQPGAVSQAPVLAGTKTVAGFDYAATGATVYASSCQACHGQDGAGVPGTFPALAGDPVVNGADAETHVRIVLHGLSGKTIGTTKYAAQMPAFPNLTDDEIAAVVDHERTSWGNHGPTITPDQVKKLR